MRNAWGGVHLTACVMRGAEGALHVPHDAVRSAEDMMRRAEGAERGAAGGVHSAAGAVRAIQCAWGGVRLTAEGTSARGPMSGRRTGLSEGGKK
jgi:hypothetical protein